eukprot:3773326-Rhodomonas_salina.1
MRLQHSVATWGRYGRGTLVRGMMMSRYSLPIDSGFTCPRTRHLPPSKRAAVGWVWGGGGGAREEGREARARRCAWRGGGGGRQGREKEEREREREKGETAQRESQREDREGM